MPILKDSQCQALAPENQQESLSLNPMTPKFHNFDNLYFLKVQAVLQKMHYEVLLTYFLPIKFVPLQYAQSSF